MSKTKNVFKDSKTMRLVITCIAEIVIATGLIIYLAVSDAYSSAVYKSATVELGSASVNPEIFRRENTGEISFINGSEANINTNACGTYDVQVKAGSFKHDCKVVVADTQAPQAGEVYTVRTIVYGATAEPSDFVSGIKDASDVQIGWKNRPDFNRPGEQEVTILLTDASGNVSEYSSHLVVSLVKNQITMEAGSPVPAPSTFAIIDDPAVMEGLTFKTNISDLMMRSVGDHSIVLSYNGGDYPSILSITDTVPPTLQVHDVARFASADSPLDITDFISSFSDESEVSFTYATEPDMSVEGVQTVTIKAVDAGGNETAAAAQLTLYKDTEAPVIKGANNLFAYENGTISYRDNLLITDNCNTDIRLQINSDSVDLKHAGVYSVTYTATDKAGNASQATVSVTVLKPQVDEDAVMKMAQDVIGQITTPNMSQYDILVAIYNWVKGGFVYSEQDEKEDWLHAAYIGFTKHTGDCYIYCMTSRALLTAAGIKNMVIDTVPLRYLHYWNLVDIGEGWHHFDTTPRRAGGDFLYLDDATIKIYSDKHQNSHIYDRNRFPDIK